MVRASDSDPCRSTQYGVSRERAGSAPERTPKQIATPGQAEGVLAWVASGCSLIAPIVAFCRDDEKRKGATVCDKERHSSAERVLNGRRSVADGTSHSPPRPPGMIGRASEECGRH